MEIIAKKREIFGKKVRILRKDSTIPAVVFGKGKQSLSLELSFNNLAKVLNAEGEATLLDLIIDGEGKDTPRKVLISEVQKNFVTGRPTHVSFHEVSLTEKITAKVSIEFIGESPAVKSGKGILITLIDEVEVECLPTDLPRKFEVDIFGLQEVDDFVTVGALKYDKSKISIDIDPEELLIKVDYAEQLEEKEEVASVEEVEVTGEKPKEEGEEAKEAVELKGSKESKEPKEQKAPVRSDKEKK